MVYGSLVNSVPLLLEKKSIQGFVLSVAAWALLLSLQTGIGYFRDRFELLKLDFELSQHLSRGSIAKFFSLSMGQHVSGNSTIKRSVMNNGQTSVSGLVYMGIYELIPVTLRVLLPIVFLFVKVPLVATVVCMMVVCFITFTVYYNKGFIPKLKELEDVSQKIGRRQADLLQHHSVVFANAQEERAEMEYDDGNKEKTTMGRPLWLSYVGWFFSGQIFISLSQSLCVALTGYLVYRGQVSSGLFITVMMWINSALGTLMSISYMQRNLAKLIAPIIKYFRFLDYEPDVIMPEKPKSIGKAAPSIEFRGVIFAYNKRKSGDDDEEEGEGKKDVSQKDKAEQVLALNDVSFKIPAGCFCAIVGSSGAGKSTIVNLLLRAYDATFGKVLFDGIDVRELNYRELRRKIGYVPQDIPLFDDTLRRNITFGLSDQSRVVTDDEIEKVAKLSRVSEFADTLEKRWETRVGERGVKLSGGQRQRVGIARALIKDPPILILDEATSSLDTRNESEIRDNIRKVAAGKTTIVIAHRLATVRDADMIIVLKNGRIVGQGTHDWLMKQNKFYRRLVGNQVIVA